MMNLQDIPFQRPYLPGEILECGTVHFSYEKNAQFYWICDSHYRFWLAQRRWEGQTKSWKCEFKSVSLKVLQWKFEELSMWDEIENQPRPSQELLDKIPGEFYHEGNKFDTTFGIPALPLTFIESIGDEDCSDQDQFTYRDAAGFTWTNSSYYGFVIPTLQSLK